MDIPKDTYYKRQKLEKFCGLSSNVGKTFTDLALSV